MGETLRFSYKELYEGCFPAPNPRRLREPPFDRFRAILPGVEHYNALYACSLVA